MHARTPYAWPTRSRRVCRSTYSAWVHVMPGLSGQSSKRPFGTVIAGGARHIAHRTQHPGGTCTGPEAPDQRSSATMGGARRPARRTVDEAAVLPGSCPVTGSCPGLARLPGLARVLPGYRVLPGSCPVTGSCPGHRLPAASAASSGSIPPRRSTSSIGSGIRSARSTVRPSPTTTSPASTSTSTIS